MQYNSFEEKLRSKLVNAEMTPRPQVWQGIEKQLPTPKEPNRNKKYLLGLLLLLLTGTTGGYIYYNTSSSPQNLHNEATLTEKKTPKPQVVSPINSGAANQEIQALVEKTQSPTNSSNKTQAIEYKISLPKEKVVANIPQTKNQDLPIAHSEKVFSPSINAPTNATNQKEEDMLIPKDIEIAASRDYPSENNSKIASSVSEEKTSIEKNKEKDTQSAAEIAQPKALVFIQKASRPSTKMAIAEKNIALNATSPRLKRPKNNKLEFTAAVGLNALLHNSGFKTDGGQIVNPFLINTTGIIQLELADSSRKIEINSTSTYKDFAGSNDVAEIRLLESANSRYISAGFVYRIRPFLGIETAIRIQKQDFSAFNVQYARNQGFYDMYQNRAGSQRLGGLSYSTYLVETPLWLSAYLPIGTPRLESVFSIGGTYRRWLYDKRTSSFVTNARGVSNFNNGKLLQYNRLIESSSSFYARSNFTIQARVGMQYHLIRNMSIFTAVHVQHLLNPMYKETFSQKTPLTVGIETGLRF